MSLCRVLSPSVLVLFAATAFADDNWPRWRGPEGNGQAVGKDIPVKWDASSIVWRTPLKGAGQSSPTIWGDRIFVTSAPDNGKSRLVTCVDKKNGQVLWEHEAWKGEPEQSHAQNGWATATCATDGEVVVAFFGKGGLHGYTLDGKQLWSRDLGPFPGVWGTAASPLIFGDLVIQNCEAAGEGKIIAVNKMSGKDVWSATRSAPERGGWSTPVLIKAGDKWEMVLNGERAVTGHDPATGKQLWTCKSFAGRGDPTVTPGKDLLYVVNGQPGDFYAIKPGGAGDVTKSHMAWHTPRKNGRDQPSPILVGNLIVVVSMSGIATTYQANDGKVVWTGERLKGAFSSSPIAANGKVYFQNEAGETTVIEPGPEFKVAATNNLGTTGEVFRASLSPSGDKIFTRSDKALYCIAAKK